MLQTMIPIRCCCKPENLIGYLPSTSNLELRQLKDDSWAFSSNDDEEGVRSMLGFVEAETKDMVSKHTWKKSWKK